MNPTPSAPLATAPAGPEAPPPAAAPHLQDAAQVAAHWGVHPGQGLDHDEAVARLQRHGPNQLPTGRSRTWVARLLAPFRDVMIGVLMAAAVISGLIGDLTDTLVILTIVLLNAAISVVQEWQAEQALSALQRLATAQAMVRRDGRAQPVPAEALVPGDVVLLEAGNLVPADLRLHEVAQLRVDESALTGESVTVAKHPDPLPDPGRVDHPVGDRHNMAWKGTLVTHGRAEGLVVATGGGTQLGQVARLLEQGGPDRGTPLQRRLAAFGQRLSGVVVAICLGVFALGWARGEPLLPMALTAISLAVAAIPEALPAVVTVLLALGARRLVQQRALVRHLPAVETLGSVTTICSDKTGTLTQNRMVVHQAVPVAPQDLEVLQTAALLCNDATPDAAGAPHAWQGDPTETALAQWALAGLAQDGGQGVNLAVRQTEARLAEWPFDASRKRMSTLHPGLGLLCKGAPESLLPRCRTDARGAALDAQAWLARAQALAGQGLRVLALAQRPGATPADAAADAEADTVEQDLSLLGLVGLIDPPRPEAAAAVAECLAAGIRPVMITGDHPQTALAIARQLGLHAPPSGADAAGRWPPVLTGADLADMDNATLSEAVAVVSVYARTDPAQKIRLVQALQARGEFTAMTGDGVNDAPALQAADIGVAMGRGGTDVARQAAGLVLLDDHFATIVAAVREGRRIFDNIRKFIRYAMTGNSAEIWVLLAGPLLGLPIALLPLHILWINLVTDGLPGLALATEPAERGVMRRPPRPPEESVFAHGLWQHTLWVGLLMAVLCLGLQAWAMQDGTRPWQTMVFTTLTLAQMAHLLAIRSEHTPLWRLGWRSNPPLLAAVALSVVLQGATVYLPVLQPVFHTQALSALELGLCLGASAVVVAAVEVEKAWRRRGGRAGHSGPAAQAARRHSQASSSQ
ncbi:cation-translocating P-type ATPase [Ideonella livida]|uniref:Cation-translocating P-type ATPase n=1 Tax=Ideonella livida TaxID=2707176 RepID=A0A7C9TKY6_9BURK|nr:cation-translocating P-type ATPase [Ideonella livida]NDY93159.1 cation-translocating P-type ATPase [Ideonella livida]